MFQPLWGHKDSLVLNINRFVDIAGRQLLCMPLQPSWQRHWAVPVSSCYPLLYASEPRLIAYLYAGKTSRSERV